MARAAAAGQRPGSGRAAARRSCGEACKNAAPGGQAVVILGHPECYPRFGFEPAQEFGLQSEYDISAEVFMARELVAGVLADVRGTVRYDSAFAGVE